MGSLIGAVHKLSPSPGCMNGLRKFYSDFVGDSFLKGSCLGCDLVFANQKCVCSLVSGHG